MSYTYSAVKDPDATIDYTVDWADWLESDTIASAAWVLSTGITLSAQSNTDTTATAWVSGGTAGTTYTATCRITTAAGRIDDRTIRLVVRDK
jgi:hypothetical protein